jgi:catechol 2,3-dioxygenase-like lactoylglutathione lyase family enzyme
LYAEDLAAAERFYHEALGLDVIGHGEFCAVFSCGGGVLLVFDPRKSAAPDREVPSHGTTGAGHVAFAVKPDDLTAWREQLRQAAIPIEREVDWDEGGRSIYFRDPAGNVVELAPTNHLGWRLEILTEVTPPNQTMKPTAPLRCNFSEVVAAPCGGLSLSR